MIIRIASKIPEKSCVRPGMIFPRRGCDNQVINELLVLIRIIFGIKQPQLEVIPAETLGLVPNVSSSINTSVYGMVLDRYGPASASANNESTTTIMLSPADMTPPFMTYTVQRLSDQTRFLRPLSFKFPIIMYRMPKTENLRASTLVTLFPPNLRRAGLGLFLLYLIVSWAQRFSSMYGGQCMFFMWNRAVWLIWQWSSLLMLSTAASYVTDLFILPLIQIPPFGHEGDLLKRVNNKEYTVLVDSRATEEIIRPWISSENPPIVSENLFDAARRFLSNDKYVIIASGQGAVYEVMRFVPEYLRPSVRVTTDQSIQMGFGSSILAKHMVDKMVRQPNQGDYLILETANKWFDHRQKHKAADRRNNRLVTLRSQRKVGGSAASEVQNTGGPGSNQGKENTDNSDDNNNNDNNKNGDHQDSTKTAKPSIGLPPPSKSEKSKIKLKQIEAVFFCYAVCIATVVFTFEFELLWSRRTLFCPDARCPLLSSTAWIKKWKNRTRLYQFRQSYRGPPPKRLMMENESPTDFILY